MEFIKGVETVEVPTCGKQIGIRKDRDDVMVPVFCGIPFECGFAMCLECGARFMDEKNRDPGERYREAGARMQAARDAVKLAAGEGDWLRVRLALGEAESAEAALRDAERELGSGARVQAARRM